MSFKTTYQSFELNHKLSITEGKGSLPIINIDNDNANASISIYAGQVLSYTPKTQTSTKSDTKSGQNIPNRDLLFVSDLAYFEQGKAIKGGIPICWPWFGKDSKNPDRQMHGFARNLLWTLEETSQPNKGQTKVVLSLKDSEETRKHWPYQFTLRLTIDVGSSLKLSLTTINNDNKPFSITQALHSYFSVTNINHIELEGLHNTLYLDKVSNAEPPISQQGSLTIDQEIDRIYLNPPAALTLHDTQSNKKTRIQSKGSSTTVVWNPWIDLSIKSSDLTNDAYQRFICVETANANKDIIVITPSDSFTIEAEYNLL